MTTIEEVQGTWNQLAGAVKSKYAQITGDDLAGVNGNIQQLAGVIQKKTYSQRLRYSGLRAVGFKIAISTQ